MKSQTKQIYNILIPAFLLFLVIIMDLNRDAIAIQSYIQNLLKELLTGIFLIILVVHAFRLEWFKERSLPFKLWALGIITLVFSTILWIFESRGSETIFLLDRILVFGILVTAIFIFRIFKELIYIQQAKRTERNF